MNRRVFQNLFIRVASLVLVAALGVFPAFAKDSGSKTFDHVYLIVLDWLQGGGRGSPGAGGDSRGSEPLAEVARDAPGASRSSAKK
jgi:hypothetical protein